MDSRGANLIVFAPRWSTSRRSPVPRKQPPRCCPRRRPIASASCSAGSRRSPRRHRNRRVHRSTSRTRKSSRSRRRWRHAERRRIAELSTVATGSPLWSPLVSSSLLLGIQNQIRWKEHRHGRWAVSGAPESAWSARSRRSQAGWRSPEVYSEPSSREPRTRGRWQAQVERNHQNRYDLSRLDDSACYGAAGGLTIAPLSIVRVVRPRTRMRPTLPPPPPAPLPSNPPGAPVCPAVAPSRPPAPPSPPSG